MNMYVFCICLILLNLLLIILLLFFIGVIYSNERFVYEEWVGIFFGLFYYSLVYI